MIPDGVIFTKADADAVRFDALAMVTVNWSS